MIHCAHTVLSPSNQRQNFRISMKAITMNFFSLNFFYVRFFDRNLTLYKRSSVLPIYIFIIFSIIGSNLFADELEQNRGRFLDAETAIDDGKIQTAERIIKSLGDYPLAPYLELEIMLKRFSAVPEEEVESFIATYENTWVGEKARINWLPVLHARNDYDRFIKHFPKTQSTILTRCQYLDALIEIGKEDEAHKQTLSLWLTGESRPDECDPVFSSWRKSKYFTEEYIWQRFVLARKANRSGFSQYLTRLVTNPSISERIENYHRIRINPEYVTNPNNFDLSIDANSELIEYGIGRLASSDPALAQATLEKYINLSLFDFANSKAQMQDILNNLMKGWTSDEMVEKALKLAQTYPALVNETHIDWQLRRALAALDWQSTLAWINLLDAEIATKDQWQYWRARANIELGIPALEIFENLSQKRSYYGHLSSVYLNRPFYIEDEHAQSNPELVENIRSSLAAQQAIELSKVNYPVNSRNAWEVVLRNLSPGHHIAAGQVAHESELHYSAIVSMARAKFWDNLTVRFPMAHTKLFTDAAQKADISSAWAYGISRQESSFAPDIRSVSGAMGLMQVMPATAKEMAGKINIRYEANRLREPDYNIPLGVAYLHQGVKELSGNMIYATAGYNAGINRIKTWLDEDQDKLPLDVWAEIIPFSETRKYVKNVMDYSVIYADKLGINAPLLDMKDRLFISIE